MINLLDKCPSCEVSWDGGEVIDVLSRMEVFIMVSQKDLRSMATQLYGWTPENKKKFSMPTVHHIDHTLYAECHKCKAAFDVIDGIQYPSILTVKNNHNETSRENS